MFIAQEAFTLYVLLGLAPITRGLGETSIKLKVNFGANGVVLNQHRLRYAEGISQEQLAHEAPAFARE